MFATNRHSDYPWCKTKNHSSSVDSHFQDVAGSVSHLFLILQAANTSKKDNDVPKSIFCNSLLDISMQPSIETPENQNHRLHSMGPDKVRKTWRLTGVRSGLVGQEGVSQVVGQVHNRTELFLSSKHGLLAGYMDQFLKLQTVLPANLGTPGPPPFRNQSLKLLPPTPFTEGKK